MRNSFVVCYDIADPKRWRSIYKLFMGVGDPVQYSVFRCELSKSEKIILEGKIIPVMNQREDRVMFINLGPSDSVQSVDDRLEWFGKPLSEMPERKAFII